MAGEFIMPGQILTGEGALTLAEERFVSMGKKALIVTDSMMVKLGNIAKLEDALDRQNIPYAIYEDINGEPTDVMIEGGVNKYREEECDFLIALGGGSPMDAMKAIGVMVSTPFGEKKISDYMGEVISVPTPPMAAIPTTAGTGSEATQFTIITDTTNNVKMLLKGSVLMPNLDIIDPQFTVTAPANITAATGLDALTHAVEAYTSKKAQPLSDSFALSAVKKIFRCLPIAFHEGSNIEAREQMAIAALEAGIAFNNASVTIVHGMSRPIGALFHVPHGLANAMLLEECLTFVLDGAYKEFAELGRAIHVANQSDDDESASHKFLKAISELCIELEIPTLTEFGVDKELYTNVIAKMASDARVSGSPSNCRKEITEQNMMDIYKKLI